MVLLFILLAACTIPPRQLFVCVDVPEGCVNPVVNGQSFELDIAPGLTETHQLYVYMQQGEFTYRGTTEDPAATNVAYTIVDAEPFEDKSFGKDLNDQNLPRSAFSVRVDITPEEGAWELPLFVDATDAVNDGLGIHMFFEGISTGIEEPDLETADELDFPEPSFASVTNALTHTVQNVGTAPLTVQPPTVTGVTNATVEVRTTSALVVQPGASAQVELDVTPTAAGPVSFALVIVSDDPDEPSLEVTASDIAGLAPNLAVSTPMGPLALDYIELDVAVGVEHVQPFTLQNTGEGPLVITAIASVGNGASADLQDQNSMDVTFPVTLVQNATLPLQVRFTP
ncbi:MAG: choice-of-anchor D domain-containing protein, partial [Phycisphaerales bacterium]|nr:choice-of-anchor D domain-containing protein [Phycisphaerales bacterium]